MKHTPEHTTTTTMPSPKVNAWLPISTISLAILVSATASYAAENLALGADASSRDLVRGQSASAIVDGDPETTWRSYYVESATAEFEVNLSGKGEFDAIVVSGTGKGKVSVQLDSGETAEPLKAFGKDFKVIHYPKLQSAGTLKLGLTGPAEQAPVRISELAVYKVDAPHLALFKNIQSAPLTSSENFRFPPEFALDGNLGTAFQTFSGWTGSDFVINLDGPKKISSVEIKDNGRLTSTTLFVSNDGKRWTKVDSADGAGILKFNPVTASQLKLELRAPKGVTIYEILVNGE